MTECDVCGEPMSEQDGQSIALASDPGETYGEACYECYAEIEAN